MTIILDTPEQIQAGRLMAIRAGLSVEIRTGMRMSRGRSCSQIATLILKEQGLVAPHKRPNKTTVYKTFNQFLVDQGFENKPLA